MTRGVFFDQRVFTQTAGRCACVGLACARCVDYNGGCLFSNYECDSGLSTQNESEYANGA